MEKCKYDAVEFGRRLRKQRKAAGFDTQDQFAAVLGVTRQAIQAYESGTNIPKAETMTEIARILNCTIDYLFLIEGAPTREASDVCRYIGITEEAVETLLEFNKRGIDLSALIVSLFRENGIFDEIAMTFDKSMS